MNKDIIKIFQTLNIHVYQSYTFPFSWKLEWKIENVQSNMIISQGVWAN